VECEMQDSMQAEIEVPRRVAGVVLALIVVVSVAVLGFLGWANSPRDGEGRPLLLTAERRAVLRYLDTAESWAGKIAEAGRHLESLMPPEAKMVTGEDAALPTLPAPVEQPADLYGRTHDAQAALAALQALASEVERAQAPDALIGLHQGLVLPALEAHLVWADGVLAAIGAPESVSAEDLAALRGDARARLTALEEALTVER
jgi:hypothetical protein